MVHFVYIASGSSNISHCSEGPCNELFGQQIPESLAKDVLLLVGTIQVTVCYFERRLMEILLEFFAVSITPV